jgi:hypothetical protein
VVGRPGTTTPMAPIIRHSTAKTCSNERTGQGRGLGEGSGGSGMESSGGVVAMGVL